MSRLRSLWLALLALGPTWAWAQSFDMPPPAGVFATACVYNAVVPSPTDTKAYFIQCDSQGRLVISVSGFSGSLGNNVDNVAPVTTGLNGVDAYGYVYNTGTASWDRAVKYTTGTANAPPTATIAVVPLPSSSSTAGLANQQTSAAASNAVLKSSPGNLYTVTVTLGATTGWLMLFDATSLPSNGATGSSLKFCSYVKSDGTAGGASFSWPTPLVFATGITAGFSSTACNSLTASATAFFYGQVD